MSLSQYGIKSYDLKSIITILEDKRFQTRYANGGKDNAFSIYMSELITKLGIVLDECSK